MAQDPGRRIDALRHRIESIRLALDREDAGLSFEVRQVLLAMLDDAERELRAAARKVPVGKTR